MWWCSILTHWGQVTHVCANELTIIGSDNGLLPGRRQAIIWINDGILLIGPLGIKFREIYIEILIFSFKKMRLKVSSVKLAAIFLDLNMLVTGQAWQVVLTPALMQVTLPCTCGTTVYCCWVQMPDHMVYRWWHHGDVIISAMASQITRFTIVYLTVYPGADQRKHQSSASVAFVRPETGEFPAQRASNADFFHFMTSSWNWVFMFISTILKRVYSVERSHLIAWHLGRLVTLQSNLKMT